MATRFVLAWSSCLGDCTATIHLRFAFPHDGRNLLSLSSPCRIVRLAPMLAVQRPMSKPPHMLFGCRFSFLGNIVVTAGFLLIRDTDSVDSSNSLYRLPSPPPLAPGPSLLDDSDTRFLDSFFDGVGSDQYLVNDPNDTWNYEWQDLPPDFLGTTSSFGPQIEPVTNDVQHLAFPDFRNTLGFIPDPLSPTEDVLAAATLLRNGNSSQPTGQQSNSFIDVWRM